MGVTVCFTGHRPDGLYGYRDAADYNRLVTGMIRVLCDIDDRCGLDRVITGGAQGTDQLAFWACDAYNARHDASRRVRNVIYIPFRSQPSRWGWYGPFGQGNYRAMLSCADETRVLASDPTTDSEATRLLMARNDAMVRDSDVVVAVAPWPADADMEDPAQVRRALNEFSHGRGGTAATVGYALRRNRDIVWLDPVRHGYVLCPRVVTRTEAIDAVGGTRSVTPAEDAAFENSDEEHECPAGHRGERDKPFSHVRVVHGVA